MEYIEKINYKNEKINKIISELNVLFSSNCIDNIKKTYNLNKKTNEEFKKEYFALLGTIMVNFIPERI